LFLCNKNKGIEHHRNFTLYTNLIASIHMRFWLPILLCFCYSLSTFSQNLEFTAQFYSESYGQKVMSIPNGKWFFAGKLYPGLWEEKEFTVIYGAIDENGGLFPFSPIENHDNSNALAIFQKDNGNYLVGAEDFECGQISNSSIYEIDDEGEVVLNYDLGLPCQNFMDIKSYQNNLYAGCANGIAQLFNSGGVSQVVSGLGEITGFIPLYNNSFLIGNNFQSANFQGIRKINQNNQVIGTLDLSAGGSVLEMEGLEFNKNVIMQAQNLYLIDDNLQILNDLSVQSTDIQFVSLDFDSDEIWVLGKNGNDNILVYGFDSNLNLIEDFAVPALGLEALDLALKENEITLVGTGNSGMYLDTLVGVPNSFAAGKNFWIKSFEKNGTGNFGSVDVSLDEISIPMPNFLNTNYSCDGINMLAGKEALLENIQVKITNQSNESLKRVVINTHIVGCPTSCNYEVESLVTEIYEGLNLAPNASIWLDFPAFEAIFHEQDLPQICLWLSSPDNKIDQNPLDNVQCKYFYNTVNTSEIEQKLEVLIFPNPVNDNLNLQFEQPLSTSQNATIFNVLGKEIQKIILEKGNTFYQISTQNFASSVYFIVMENGKNLRFVK